MCSSDLYNFPQGRVTDHRINLTLYKLADVMGGDLSELLQALQTEHQAEELAARVGCAPSHLSLIETGKREPRVSLLQDLADQLGVPVADLVSTHAPSERDALEVALERFQESPTYRETGLPIVRPGKTMPTAVLQALQRIALRPVIDRHDHGAARLRPQGQRVGAALGGLGHPAHVAVQPLANELGQVALGLGRGARRREAHGIEAKG